MKLKSLILSIFMLTGCKFGCDTEKVISNSLSGTIAKGLNCANQAAIQKSVEAILDKSNICTEQDKKTGPIAMVVCPIIAETAVVYLGSKIPESWECKPATAEQTVAGVFSMFCSMLPF